MIICRTQKQIEHKIIEIEKLIDEYPHMSDSTLNELEGMTLALYWILIPADTKLNKTMELIASRLISVEQSGDISACTLLP